MILPGAEAVQSAAEFGVLAMLVWAACSDFRTRTIPDGASGVVVVAGFAQRLTLGPEAAALSCLAALAVLAVLVLAHARGMLGGGDVKLMAALSAGFSPPGTLRFLTLVALAGGVLALAYLALGRILRGRPAMRPGGGALGRLARVEAWRIRRRGPLPYGVAIACGGAWMILGGLA